VARSHYYDAIVRTLVPAPLPAPLLAPLLEHRLDPWFITRQADGSLRVAPGVLAHTNGISLLADQGFGAGIEQNAARVCAWLGERETAPGEGAVVMLEGGPG